MDGDTYLGFTYVVDVAGAADDGDVVDGLERGEK